MTGRLVSLLCVFTTFLSFAHELHQSNSSNDNPTKLQQGVLTLDENQVMYLGNEALLIKSGGTSIMFDPFFHHDFGIYQKVPQDIKRKIMNAEKPFDSISAIFISHAHRDHFAADDMIDYLTRFPHVLLFASNQAIEQVIREAKKLGKTIPNKQLHAIALEFASSAWQKDIAGLNISAVRIPHAGWPRRKEVENLVFSVTFNKGASVMHMGDADININHYQAYKSHWQEIALDINFPPYWFLTSAEGRDILSTIIGAKKNVGIHVPMKVPHALRSQNQTYFDAPSTVINLN